MAKLSKKNQAVDDGDAWLMSYADMMTLIACFFILLIAFASFDPVGFTVKTQEIANHFNRDKNKASDTPMEILQEEISTHPELLTKSKTSVTNTELKISFSGSVIFNDYSAELSRESIRVIDTMIDLIRSKNPNFQILIEGHTDNSVPPPDTGITSNWSLSGQRAAAIAERFEFYGFDPKKIVAIGMSDTKPLVPNQDETGARILENMQMNRRVIIKVLEPIDKNAAVKLGLGVYFDDSKK